jgi:hypothetical protein
MSYLLPVFTYAIDCSQVRGRSLTEAEALNLVPDDHWICASTNWYYQALVRDLCAGYAGFDELLYLTQIVAVVSPDQIPAKVQAIHRLMAAIEADVVPFSQILTCGDTTTENIRTYIAEAEVSRNFDDDSAAAFANFFTFLVSHVAALEEAARGGKCLVYVQSQP